MNEMFRRMLNLPVQASSVARDIDWLHIVVISTTVGGTLLVTAVTLYFLLRDHEGRTRRRPRGVSWPLEVAVISGLLSLFLGFWVVGFHQYVHLQTPPKDALDVYVVAKQWMWAFAYPDGSVSNHDLHVPVGRPVRLLMTSRDVVHSFFVPAFRIKQDVVPGRMTVTWFEATKPGRYDIFCAEYCGLSHSGMRGSVIAVPAAHYEEWKGESPHEAPVRGRATPLVAGAEAQPAGSLAAAGERVAAEQGCLRCHTIDGTPHLGPTWAGLYESQVALRDGDERIADAAYLTESMMDPAARVHEGFPDIMPSYLGLLSAGEVGALVAFIRSLSGLAPGAGNVPLARAADNRALLPTQDAGMPLAPATADLRDAASKESGR